MTTTRAILLLNSKDSMMIETAKFGPQFAEKSIGFDFRGDINNTQDVINNLKELIKGLEAPTVEDKEIF